LTRDTAVGKGETGYWGKAGKKEHQSTMKKSFSRERPYSVRPGSVRMLASRAPADRKMRNTARGVRTNRGRQRNCNDWGGSMGRVRCRAEQWILPSRNRQFRRKGLLIHKARGRHQITTGSIFQKMEGVVVAEGQAVICSKTLPDRNCREKKNCAT